MQEPHLHKGGPAMIKIVVRSICLFLLIGSSVYALSPRLGDSASDARRDAERQRRRQEDIRREEEQRQIRKEEEAKQRQRLHPPMLVS